MSRLEPSSRADYPVLRPLQVRWEDIDIYGHVNNVVYLSYFDTAVNGWYVEQGILEMGASPHVFLVAETGAQYFREIRFGETVRCGMRVERLGRSSVTYDLALFTDTDKEGDEASAPLSCARGRYVHVLVDEATRRPAPIEGAARAKLEGLT